MDTVQVEQSKEKGKPFLIPSSDGTIVKAFPKPALPDFVPMLEIHGIKNQTAERLTTFQYVIGLLPILLLFLGGAIGGAIGAVGAITNFYILRQEGTEMSKYAKVIGIIMTSYIVYTLVVTAFL